MAVAAKNGKRNVVRETVGGEEYVYLPLGRHIVSAPEVCGGRPTFKYTRIEVAGVLAQLAGGYSLDKLIAGYQGKISKAAVLEAAKLAGKALLQQNSGHALAS